MLLFQVIYSLPRVEDFFIVKTKGELLLAKIRHSDIFIFSVLSLGFGFS